MGNDTIDGGAGFDVLRLDFNILPPDSSVISQLSDRNSGEYDDGYSTVKFTNIEAIEVFGSNNDDVLVALTSSNNNNFGEPVSQPMESRIDGGEGKDKLVADYSDRSEDLMFNLQSQSNYNSFDYPSLDGSIEVNAFDTGYYNRIEFNNIEGFSLTSGRGNDNIELGYDNFSDDEINAGAGNDYINAGLGNDTIDGGAGNDTFVYQLGYGTDIISDDSGTNDTISLLGINLNDLSLDFNNEDLVFSFTGFPEERLIIENYANSLDSIETIEVEGQIFSIEEIITSRTHPITIVENGSQLVANYSDYAEDLEFILNPYDANPSLDIRSLVSGDSHRINIERIESLAINSGSGNDFIDMGYNYFSPDQINAGAGDDVIAAGWGNDTVNGGRGSDRYIYQLGDGVDIILDSAGENDTIYLDWGITLDSLNLYSDDRDLTISFTDSPEDRLIIENYVNSPDSIETIEVEGQIFSIEEIIDLKSKPKFENIGEFGQVNNFNHNSQTIQFDRSYENPVVFALPLSRNEDDPSIVRITDIENDSFTAYLQEAEYEDGIHGDESFSYLVLEAGTWELGNGSLLEVGTVDTNVTTAIGREDWEDIDFNADFVDTPVILSQVQTNLDSEFVRTRQSDANLDGFRLSLEEEEALRKSGHGRETVGWLAIDASYGGSAELSYQARHTGRQIDHRLSEINFTQNFASEPSLFASLSSFYGADPAGLRYQSITPTQASIMLEEDRSRDVELDHTKESVDFLAIAGTGDITAIAYEPFI